MKNKVYIPKPIDSLYRDAILNKNKEFYKMFGNIINKYLITKEVASQGSVHDLKKLVDKGFKLNKNILTEAIVQNNIRNTKFILDNAKDMNIFARDIYGDTPLRVAIDNKEIDSNEPDRRDTAFRSCLLIRKMTVIINPENNKVMMIEVILLLLI